MYNILYYNIKYYVIIREMQQNIHCRGNKKLLSLNNIIKSTKTIL